MADACCWGDRVQDRALWSGPPNRKFLRVFPAGCDENSDHAGGPIWRSSPAVLALRLVEKLRPLDDQVRLTVRRVAVRPAMLVYRGPDLAAQVREAIKRDHVDRQIEADRDLPVADGA